MLKLTARPEEAVALTVKSLLPKTLFGSGPKLMAWSALFTTCTSCADVLGADLVSPSYDAVREWDPTDKAVVVSVARAA